MHNITIETGIDHEIWCTISGTNNLNDKIIDEIKAKVIGLIPGNERLFINIEEITTVNSSSISALRKLMTEFMHLGCTVRFASINSNLGEIFEYLTLSSDG